MAKRNAKQWSDENPDKGGGGGKYPQFFKDEQAEPVCIVMDVGYTLSKSGKWGVALLLVSVDPNAPEGAAPGTVGVWKGWNEKMMMRTLVRGFGCKRLEFDDGLPDPNTVDNEPEQDSLGDVASIVYVSDQRDPRNSALYNPAIPAVERRLPFVKVSLKRNGQYVEIDWVNDLRGVSPGEGPYRVEPYFAHVREVMQPEKAKWYREWFQDRLVTEIERAQKAIREGGSSGGSSGGTQQQSGGYDSYDDGYANDDIPF